MLNCSLILVSGCYLINLILNNIRIHKGTEQLCIVIQDNIWEEERVNKIDQYSRMRKNVYNKKLEIIYFSFQLLHFLNALGEVVQCPVKSSVKFVSSVSIRIPV